MLAAPKPSAVQKSPVRRVRRQRRRSGEALPRAFTAQVEARATGRPSREGRWSCAPSTARASSKTDVAPRRDPAAAARRPPPPRRGLARGARARTGARALRAGPEREVAATKTFTATCVGLALLAATTAEARGRSALSLAGLAEAVAEAVESEADAARIARAIARAPAMIVLGRGYLYPAA